MRKSLTSLLLATIALSPNSLGAQIVSSGSAIETYLAAQRYLRRHSRMSDSTTAAAFEEIKAAQNAGLGTCTGQNRGMTQLFVLEFLKAPDVACGEGQFSNECKNAFNNCSATPFGIFCDFVYLVRLEFLARLVLSVHQANPENASHTPAEGMRRIAALERVYQSSRGDSAFPSDAVVQGQEFVRMYAWSDRGPSDNFDRMVARAGLLGAVIGHEASHLEQAGCGLTAQDPRYERARELLEAISCRVLTRSEVRADMRAIDMATGFVGAVESSYKSYGLKTPDMRRLYLRAQLARLEYEIFILSDPSWGFTLFGNEPSKPSELWKYYFQAGVAHEPFVASGHIPPELRVLATLWLNYNRGALSVRDIESMSDRVLPFLTGLFWRQCRTQDDPTTVRKFVEYLMLGRSISW